MRKNEPSSPIKTQFSWQLFGEMTLKIKGLNQTKLLNALSKEGVLLKKVKKSASNDLDITIKNKDAKKTFAICERMCYTYVVEVYRGLLPHLKGKAKRLGVVVGIALIFTLTALSSSVVTEVKVVGAPSTVEREICLALSKNGIERGKLVKSVNRDKIRSLALSVDGVADCSVNVDGTRLVITVTNRKYEQDGQEKITALTSSYNATVTKVVCRSGTAKVSVGDRVKKGDVLIENVLYDANGEVTTSVSAEGEIYGIISQHKKYVLSDEKVEFTLTGKSKTRTTLSLFGIKIGKKNSPYERSVSKRTNGVLSAIVPVKVEQTTYYETRLTEVTLTVDELKILAEERAREQTFLGEACLVKSNAVQLSQGLYEISVYLEREGIISEEQ